MNFDAQMSEIGYCDPKGFGDGDAYGDGNGEGYGYGDSGLLTFLLGNGYLRVLILGDGTGNGERGISEPGDGTGDGY